jgi:hypothetical protein
LLVERGVTLRRWVAEHIPAEERQQIIDSYPEREREARIRGVPILSSGCVFPFPFLAL